MAKLLIPYPFPNTFLTTASTLSDAPNELHRTFAGKAAMHPTPRLRFFVLNAILLAINFAVDLSTPLGWADGFLYLIPLILTFRLAPPHYLVGLAGLCSVMIILGWIFSPPGGTPWPVTYNRSLGIAAVWMTALFLEHRKKVEEELCIAQAQLEGRVEERTRDLQKSINLLEKEVIDRKQAEEALQESEQQLRLLNEYANDAIFYLDLNGVVRRASRQATVLTGRPIAELAGHPIMSVLTPEGAALATARLAAVRRGEPVPPLVELEFSRPDGETVWVEANITSVQEHGSVVGRLVVARDITARKRAEEALHESEERFRAFMNNSSVLAWIKDEQGHYVYVNRPFELRHQKTFEEVKGKTDFDFRPEETAQQFWVNDQYVLSSGKPLEVYETAALAKGGPYWLVHKFPITNAAGERFVGGLAIDITERKQAEQERAHLFTRVRDAHEALRLLSRRLLEVQDEERRRIAQELHDETGQFLTSILVGLRTLKTASTVAAAQAQATQLKKITSEALREVQRMARGLHPAVLEDVGLDAALRHLAKESAKVHGFSVDLHIDGLGERRLPPQVEATLYRIVQEALTNIARHAAAKHVGILLQCTQSVIKLIVEDDGCGFDAERALNTGVRAKGLGLLGMRERISLLNGSITIESSPEIGTTIYVQMPRETVSR